MELKKSDYPSYFTAMLWERTIAAHDAHKDARTACFSRPYLEPLNIASMLDVPIWTNLGMGGILCHEQLDRPRRWLADEEDVAYSLAGFVAAVLSQH
jgi:GAF domain-containing protein